MADESNRGSNATPSLLTCGCEPTEIDLKDNQPTCLHGTKETQIVNLAGRQAKCCYCGRTTASDAPLKGYNCVPFFVYRPEREYDEMYDGCRGWD